MLDVTTAEAGKNHSRVQPTVAARVAQFEARSGRDYARIDPRTGAAIREQFLDVKGDGQRRRLREE